LLTLGKGISDMIFPFALTLYSAAIQERLDRVHSDLPQSIRQKYGYDWGYKTTLNALQRARDTGLEKKVRATGQLFQQVLGKSLGSCPSVREIRVHGLLIAIELNTTGWPARWLRGRVASLCLLNMVRHPTFPLLMGYCQYEPDVLKLTPPLTTTPE